MTDDQAIDEVFGILNTLLPTLNGVVGYAIDMRWQGAEKPTKPDQSKIWLRASTQVVTSGQSSLSNANAVKRFNTVAIVFIQLFCPRLTPNSLPIGRGLAVQIRDQYRKDSPSNQIWFRDQKWVEVNPSEDFYQLNVSATYEYQTIQ